MLTGPTGLSDCAETLMQGEAEATEKLQWGHRGQNARIGAQINRVAGAKQRWCAP